MPTRTQAHKTSAKSSSQAATRRTAAPRRAPSDAVKLLVADHKEVRALFKDYDKLVKAQADGGERASLAHQICLLLTVHATIEEEIFYPAARQALSEGDLLDEAEVEHASAKSLISQIETMSPDDALYDAKVKVLGEYIEHHVAEEEGELFPKLKKSKLDLAELGLDMADRKAELLSQLQNVVLS